MFKYTKKVGEVETSYEADTSQQVAELVNAVDNVPTKDSTNKEGEQ